MKTLQTIPKILASVLALGVLVWMFWNPSSDPAETSIPSKQPVKPSKSVRSLPRLNVDGSSALFIVTGRVGGVRLRDVSGAEHRAGGIPAGQYQIISRVDGQVTDHGSVQFAAGDRKRIHCAESGCGVWKPN